MHSRKSFQLVSVLAVLAGLLLFVGGCAKEQKKTDPFFEKWKEMAAQSKGHTPTPVKRELEARIAVEPEEVVPAKDLPQVIVGSLDMRNADIVAVLRALGKIAGQSIMVSPKVEGLINVSVQKVPWDQVFKSIVKTHGLSWEWEGDILRVMTVEDIENAIKMGELRNRQPLVTSSIRVHYADAKNLKEDLEKLLTKDAEGNVRGSVEVAEHNNSLIVNSVKGDVRKVIDLVEAIDKPSKQVRIKAYIVETTNDTARALGVMWGGGYTRTSIGGQQNDFWATPGGSNPTGDPINGSNYTPNLGNGAYGMSGQGMFSNFYPDLSESVQGTSMAFMFGKLGGNILEMQLTALQEDSKLNILSSPSITTLDNQTAVTENGEEVPYITLDEAGNAEVEWKEALIKLEITPHLIDGQNLKLDILVNKDEVDFTRDVSGNPLIIKKKTKTTLVSRDGETVVISGLTRKRLTDSSSGIPEVQDIPLLGNLFRTDSKGNVLEEVLVFITPYVLPEWEAGEVQKTLKEVEAEHEARQKAEEAEEDEG